jgi:site-specific recombinase XerD
MRGACRWGNHDYVRAQLDQQPKPTPQTINHRLTVLRCLYRCHYGQEISRSPSEIPRGTPAPFSYGRQRRRLPAGLRLKQAHRVIVPLAAAEIAQFWNSFSTFRDLALVALMLLDGLRSCEVLDLRLEDLDPSQAQMLVLGKGNKKRLLPLPQEAIQATPVGYAASRDRCPARISGCPNRDCETRRVKGQERFLYRAVDSSGQTIDFLLTAKRDTAVILAVEFADAAGLFDDE